VRESHRRLDTQINRGVAWTAASQSIVAVADLVSQAWCVAAWIGQTKYGIAMLAVPLYSILDAISDLGGTSALIAHDDHTPERLSTLFWFNVFLSTALFALLLVAGPLYGHLQSHPVVGSLLIAYGAKLLLQNFSAVPYALLRKELRFAEVAKIRTIAYLAESVTRIVFAAKGLEIWAFTLAALSKHVVFAVLFMWRHPFVPKLVFRYSEIAHYVRYGLRSAASQVLYYTYTNVDYPIVGYFFGADANGLYSLAYWIVLEAVKTIANVVIDVALPTFARVRDDRERLIAQFIKLTRLNLIAVLPFVVLIVLVVPEFLQLVYSGGKWSPAQLVICGQAARILCAVGLLRALGFIGPPLLDGIGRPGLTLRYMIVAAIAVPTSFVIGANLLGDHLNFLSVAVAWAVGYPIAFAGLMYLIATTIQLPIARYARASAGIFGCAAAGLALGLTTDYLIVPHAHAGIRLAAIGSAAVAGTFGALAIFEHVTPRSIIASLRG
jgi:O-antigen/teichoic acid export membrane protein